MCLLSLKKNFKEMSEPLRKLNCQLLHKDQNFLKMTQVPTLTRSQPNKDFLPLLSARRVTVEFSSLWVTSAHFPHPKPRGL